MRELRGGLHQPRVDQPREAWLRIGLRIGLLGVGLRWG